MARMKVRINTKNLRMKLNKSFIASADWSEVSTEIRDLLVNRIRKKGILGNGQKITALSTKKNSTIKWRKRIASKNTTHPSYAPRRSNLTLTGTLLNMIKGFSRINRKKGSVTIGIGYTEKRGDPATHPGYSGWNRKRPIPQILDGLETVGKQVIPDNLDSFKTEIRKFIKEYYANRRK